MEWWLHIIDKWSWSISIIDMQCQAAHLTPIVFPWWEEKHVRRKAGENANKDSTLKYIIYFYCIKYVFWWLTVEHCIDSKRVNKCFISHSGIRICTTVLSVREPALVNVDSFGHFATKLHAKQDWFIQATSPCGWREGSGLHVGSLIWVQTDQLSGVLTYVSIWSGEPQGVPNVTKAI